MEQLKDLDYSILAYIEERGMQTAKDLSCFFKCDKALIYKSLNRLEKRCLILSTLDNPKKFVKNDD